MEIRLAGRRQDSGGVADEARSLLLMEALERWVDSVCDVGGGRMIIRVRRILEDFCHLKMLQSRTC